MHGSIERIVIADDASAETVPPVDISDDIDVNRREDSGSENDRSRSSRGSPQDR